MFLENGSLDHFKGKIESKIRLKFGNRLNMTKHQEKTHRRHIISISSDIGLALANKWLDEGHQVSGTYRTHTLEIEKLVKKGAEIVFCDLTSAASINKSTQYLNGLGLWDSLVVAPGSLEPIGMFEDTRFNQWSESVNINFIQQFGLLHGLLPSRNTQTSLGPLVLFFAGGGVNNAPKSYSAYIISKIASIKMCELLDAEIIDTRFSIVGPGWVKTKIHEATLEAVDRAGENYGRTVEMMESNNWVPMSKIFEFCDWLINSPRSVIGGRNFSLVNDEWGTKELDKSLALNKDMYKLRRSGN